MNDMTEPTGNNPGTPVTPGPPVAPSPPVAVAVDAAVDSAVDDQAPSALARRAGPIIAVASLVLTVGLVTWMALAPTNVAGTVADGPFTVPGTLVTPADSSGCLDIIDGRGSIRTLCVDGVERYSEVFFDETGRLLVGASDGEGLLVVDQTTAAVLDQITYEQAYSPVPDGRPFDELGYAYTEGSKVFDSETNDLLLDIEGPIGYRLQQAVVSPDGQWVVAVDPRDRVIIAPTDGSAAPRVWADIDVDGYVDISRGIRWE